MFVTSSRGVVLVRIARIRAVYLAGSWYITWLSLNEVFTSIAGYALAAMFV
jgi:hypothetical protein